MLPYCSIWICVLWFPLISKSDVWMRTVLMQFCLFTCIKAFLGLTCVFVFPLDISSLAPVQPISLFLINNNKMYEYALRKDVHTNNSRQNDKAGMTLKDSNTFFFTQNSSPSASSSSLAVWDNPSSYVSEHFTYMEIRRI